MKRLGKFHARPRDCIDIAAMPGVAKLVLNHHLARVRPDFKAGDYAGKVVTGNDFDLIGIWPKSS